MATQTDLVAINIPTLPAKHDDFIGYVTSQPRKSMLELLEPYKRYDTELRKVFAQQPDHPAATVPNVVPVFAGHEKDVNIRARNLAEESDKHKEAYIMPLKDEDRRADGSPAIVQSLKDFRTNFNVFSESALVDLDWSNVIVAGSAVVTSLLAVPNEHGGSKRALREYYHEQLAPASDVDLFLYGLTEEQAIEKIKKIEQNIRDALLGETTTIRTKNAITIASQYPTRHVQIVLRIYKNISEVLTGFDVDCSCAAYDGKQVYASPRALVAYMTQINPIDLTRRSPSYENRLSKYSHRGFEVYWPDLERDRIDPTIFERSFGRTQGLARLLILEKLPQSSERDAYVDQRREERGRPALNRSRLNDRKIWGDIKSYYEDEVAEWVDADEVSDYHTFTVPYGPKLHAKKIEKLFYVKDLLLNAEWNKPKDREVNLHRHPAFFGTTEDVFQDCCGYCPTPSTVEEEEVAQEENKIYISGSIEFIKDNPGRQSIGSFNPLTDDDWTEMAYVGNTARLCQAIVDCDVEYVQTWLEQEGNDPNTRDYTGRAPLHLAATTSSPEVVQCLIDHGARLVARLVDGKTALHLAAIRGSVEISSALLRKSEANGEEEEKKVDARRDARKAAKKTDDANEIEMKDAATAPPTALQDRDNEADIDMMDDDAEDKDMDATTENSMVNIKTPRPKGEDSNAVPEDDEDEPDVYDVNVIAWDIAASPLHIAILKGHTDVVRCLVQDFGADVLLPVKLVHDHDMSARSAILTLVLALRLPLEKAKDMTKTLLELGASAAQADMDQVTSFQYCVAAKPEMLEFLTDADKTGTSRAINHASVGGISWFPSTSVPLLTAIQAEDTSTALVLLRGGAKSEIDFATFMKAFQAKFTPNENTNRNKEMFQFTVEQPVVIAVNCEMPLLAKALLEEYGANPNTLSTQGHRALTEDWQGQSRHGKSLLDVVKDKIREMREWKPKLDKNDPPMALEDDSYYLKDLEEGTYAHWSASFQLDGAKRDYKRDWRAHMGRVEQSRDQRGVEEKQAAVLDLLADFRKLETALIEKDAKSFKELHPDIQDPGVRNNFSRSRERQKPKPFKIEFTFQLSYLSDESHARYMRLFEAAWSGDITTVKELTLQSWKDKNGEDQPPLKIAAETPEMMNTFAAAIVNGHFELADTIMEIAKVQYVLPDAAKSRRYHVEGGEEGGSGDTEIRIGSELVDEQFTVETIGEVSMQVNSTVKPVHLIKLRFPGDSFVADRHAKKTALGTNGRSALSVRSTKHKNNGSIKLPDNLLTYEEKRKIVHDPKNLIQHALFHDDRDLLVFLLELSQEHTRTDPNVTNSGAAVEFFALNDDDFRYALLLDRPQLVAEMIKSTGVGIPLSRLIEEAGIEVQEKPKYYQGLSVHGKKRADWANRGRENTQSQPIENEHPPLLRAAQSGSLECVEWFLSDAAMRCYMEFADANKDDKRLQRVAQAFGGFEALTRKFLDARSELAMHCVVLAKETPKATRLLKYLVKAMPKTMEAKSLDGLTPLLIAFNLGRKEAASILIDAGADQTCHDKSGKNVVHMAVTRFVDQDSDSKKLSAMLDLIDKRVLYTLFTERCADSPGSLTPLARWLTLGNGSSMVLETILQHSKGAELMLINGEGDSPLHVTVRRDLGHLTDVLLKYSPGLMFRENATGRTTFEMAEDALLAENLHDPPDTWRNKKSVLDRSPSSFLEGKHEVSTARQRTWTMLANAREKVVGQEEAKRRLVSLSEANEVARRLVSMKRSGTRRHQALDPNAEMVDEVPEAAVSDEVQAWMG